MVDRPETDLLDLTSADAYGRSFADVYDRWYHDVSDASATAAFVAARCDGPVLELGVGSGRLAGPMADRGLTVVGLDGSRAMLEQGRGDLPDNVHLVLADMRRLPFAPRRNPHRAPEPDQTTRPAPPTAFAGFGAVLIAFNTVFNLSSEQQQQELFDALPPLLVPGGVVIIEALDASSLTAGPTSTIGVRTRTDEQLVVTATTIDRRDQTITGQHLEIAGTGVTVRPWRLRWLSSDQLDGLAAAAGLTLVERYRNWDGEPFGPEADTHISVYRAAP
ncbi:MAG: class I SAM-dependent methyltransferase [Actinomycetota bacterium]